MTDTAGYRVVLESSPNPLVARALAWTGTGHMATEPNFHQESVEVPFPPGKGG